MREFSVFFFACCPILSTAFPMVVLMFLFCALLDLISVRCVGILYFPVFFSVFFFAGFWPQPLFSCCSMCLLFFVFFVSCPSCKLVVTSGHKLAACTRTCFRLSGSSYFL